MSNRKIIACVVTPGQVPGTSEVQFISESGYVAGTCLDTVISTNVTGDRVIVMCESQLTHKRWINIYDANTCGLIDVQPV